MAKVGMGWQATAAAGTFVAAPGGAIAIGQAAGIEPGWRRWLIGTGLAAAIAGVLAIFKASRPTALPAAIAGAISSLALFAEPAARRWWARRQAAQPTTPPATQPPATQPKGTQQLAGVTPPALNPPAVQQQPIVIQAPAQLTKPTTIEQLMPLFTTMVQQIPGTIGALTHGGTAAPAKGGGAAFARVAPGGATFAAVQGGGATFAANPRASLYSLSRN